MNSLVIKNLTLDSREVAGMVGKRHDHLIRDIERYIEYLDNPDLGNGLKSIALDFFIETSYKSGTPSRDYKKYDCTKKGCEFIAHKLTGQKGAIFTATYIDRFHEMEEALKEKERPIEINSKFMYQLAEQLEEKEKQIALMKPKAVFADAVATSHTTILVGELAKLLRQNGIEMGQNRLFDWLRNNGFLIKRKGTGYNMPTQYSMELELFEVKETSISKPDGHILISKTPKVTGKGQLYFINKFLELKEE